MSVRLPLVETFGLCTTFALVVRALINSLTSSLAWSSMSIRWAWDWRKEVACARVFF